MLIKHGKVLFPSGIGKVTKTKEDNFFITSDNKRLVDADGKYFVVGNVEQKDYYILNKFRNRSWLLIDLESGSR